MMHGTFNCKPHPRPRAALPPLLAALLWVGGCVFAGALLASGDANASDNDCDPAMSGCGLQPAGPISGPTPPAMPKKNVRETDGGNSLSNEARANAAAEKARIERGTAARGAQKLDSLPANQKAVGSER
ncbi:hypothetical protein [Ralstonia solanacearum]|uniref:hypothetical protein n=1 Tax=Ralstonia solanacearum TaxID=305 RepID=UPI001FF731DA